MEELEAPGFDPLIAGERLPGFMENPEVSVDGLPEQAEDLSVGDTVPAPKREPGSRAWDCTVGYFNFERDGF